MQLHQLTLFNSFIEFRIPDQSTPEHDAGRRATTTVQQCIAISGTDIKIGSKIIGTESGLSHYSSPVKGGTSVAWLGRFIVLQSESLR